MARVTTYPQPPSGGRYSTMDWNSLNMDLRWIFSLEVISGNLHHVKMLPKLRTIKNNGTVVRYLLFAEMIPQGARHTLLSSRTTNCFRDSCFRYRKKIEILVPICIFARTYLLLRTVRGFLHSIMRRMLFIYKVAFVL